MFVGSTEVYVLGTGLYVLSTYICQFGLRSDDFRVLLTLPEARPVLLQEAVFHISRDTCPVCFQVSSPFKTRTALASIQPYRDLLLSLGIRGRETPKVQLRRVCLIADGHQSSVTLSSITFNSRDRTSIDDVFLGLLGQERATGFGFPRLVHVLG